MNIIMKERNMGKTTSLIFASEITGLPIVVSNNKHLDYIIGKAKELQAKTPDVFTVQDLRAGKLRGRGITDVLVDDMEQIIGEAIDSYLGVHVVAGTMTKKNDER